MKNFLLKVLSLIIGPAYGFRSKGNEQWYYTLSFVINAMLIWWLKPEMAILFTSFMLFHYATVILYACFELHRKGDIAPYVYFGSHVVMWVVAIIFSPVWAIVTAVITALAVFAAPDRGGNNVFFQSAPPVDKRIPLYFNAGIFAIFVIIDLLLPVRLWAKIMIIICALILHPFIDYLEKYGITFNRVILDAINKVEKGA